MSDRDAVTPYLISDFLNLSKIRIKFQVLCETLLKYIQLFVKRR